MKRTLIILFALSVALNVFLGGFVVGRMLGAPDHGRDLNIARHSTLRFAKHFDGVSPEARASFREAFADNRATLAQNHRETRRLRSELGEALATEPWDRGRIDAVLAELREAEAAQAEALSEVLVDAFSRLSPEDRRAMITAMENEKMRFKHGRRPGQGPGPGREPGPPPPGE